MSRKAWKLSHKFEGQLIKYSLTLQVGPKQTETYQLTINLNAPPAPYVSMQQWFLNLFQTIWWKEPDGRNWLFYNQVIDDFIKIVVKYREDPDVQYPF